MSNERLRLAETYRRYAASRHKRRAWDAENPGNRAIRAELVAAATALAEHELVNARAILDVGCGSGWWLQQLSTRREIQASLHGVEILPERTAAARRRVPDAHVLTADARQLPFPSAHFDVVSLFTVLSSMPATGVRPALVEAARVLAPRGILLLWEPRIPNPLNRSTSLIREPAIRDALPGARIDREATTLFPPLARHLSFATAALYPRLTQFAALRSHWLWGIRPDAPAPPSVTRVAETPGC